MSIWDHTSTFSLSCSVLSLIKGANHPSNISRVLFTFPALWNSMGNCPPIFCSFLNGTLITRARQSVVMNTDCLSSGMRISTWPIRVLNTLQKSSLGGLGWAESVAEGLGPQQVCLVGALHCLLKEREYVQPFVMTHRAVIVNIHAPMIT